MLLALLLTSLSAPASHVFPASAISGLPVSLKQVFSQHARDKTGNCGAVTAFI